MIDPEGPVPVYKQVADVVAGRIAVGQLLPNRPIPSEKQLEGEFGVSRGTARKAVEELRKRNLVFTVPHRGTYVLPLEERGR
jgi:DNA-binding GntR family transcriptional regulator